MGQVVLVTGGAGYIGSHTAKALAEAGHLPVVYDNLSNGHRQAVQWGPFIHGDIRDRAGLVRALKDHGATAVIHFAGRIEVGESMIRPDLYWDHNVGGMASMLDAIQTCGVAHLVFSSTAAVYGTPDGLGLLRETDPTAPINPYGDTKLAGERMIAAACQAFGLSAIALRYFNACGADPSGALGEAHTPETHLIPRALEAALGLGPCLTVNGTDFPTPDGTCIRDYVHVSDLADAHVRAVNLAPTTGQFRALNLGTGQGTSVRDILAGIDRVLGRRTGHATGPRRAGDPDRLVADPSSAQALLGWKARHSQIDTILATALQWRRAPAFGLEPPMDRAA